MQNDLVRFICEQAVTRFGTRDMFNGVTFADAFAAVSGSETRLDGRCVRTILAGRQDVQVLSGDSNYRLLGHWEGVPIAAVTPKHTY